MMDVIVIILYTGGVDYASTALVFNITITARSTSSSFSEDLNDMTQEGNETFNIAIRLLPSCLSLSLGTSSSTVTIIDNDGKDNMQLVIIITAIVQWQ